METSLSRWNKSGESSGCHLEKGLFRSRLLVFLGILLFALLGGLMAMDVFYSSDAIGYQFMIPPGINEFSMERIGTIGDVWESQINHWHTVNGRFICHFIVQVFCGLLPRRAWALSNGILYGYLIWLSGNLHRFIPDRHDHSEYGDRPEIIAYGCWIAIIIFLISFPKIDFAPPMQVNYVWGLAMEISFIVLFFRGSEEGGVRGGSIELIGLFIVSFMAGQWNEAYVIPVLIGLGVYCKRRKMKLDRYGIVGLTGFLIGAALLCLAPGNMVRLEDTGFGKTTLTDFMREFVFSSWPLIVGAAASSLLFGCDRIRKTHLESLFGSGTYRDGKRNIGYMAFLSAVIVGSYLLGIGLHFSSGPRVTVAAVMGIYLFILTEVGRRPIRLWGLVILGVIGGVVGYWKIESQISASRRFEMYDELYHQSEDGRIYVPTDILQYDWRESRFVSFYLTYKKNSHGRAAAPIKILPEEVRKVKRDSDYNDIIRLSGRVYLFVRSESHPARFFIRRRLGLPGTELKIPIHDRELDFDSPSGDIAVDTLPFVRLGLYVNEQPYVEGVPYMVGSGSLEDLPE